MSLVKKYCYLAVFFFCLFFLLPLAKNVFAEKEYKTEYNVEYFPKLNGDSRVRLRIKIIHLRSDVYVKEFSLSFPNTFTINDINAYDDKGEVIPQIEPEERSFKIKLAFNAPNVGRNSENNFYLNYLQKNLFKINGNVWEIILPVISDQEDSIFNIIFHLPKATDKKLSIAKPLPTLIRDNKIFWENVQTKTVYAVFGNSQFYKVTLIYHLQNEKLFPVYFDIAFPPETLYQKIFVKSINPLPAEVFLDDDGNYLGRYVLKSKERKEIIFDGFIETLTEPQEDFLPYIRQTFIDQKKYLLSPQKFWTVNQKKLTEKEIAKIATAQDVYNFVNQKLTYNYQRIDKKMVRLGADKILDQPNQAICMEFTDLFIALAREKGIYAREINGYGFSDDSNLRPLSLSSDLLHSWPEYFDNDKQIWIPVDPTWENTSGIDYFHSLDLNHLTFVIHGKDPILPLSAGMYKIEDSKDVEVSVVSQLPEEKINLIIDGHQIEEKVIDRKKYQTKIVVINKGNVFLKNSFLEWKSREIEFQPKKIFISLLAPYQKVDYQVYYQSRIKNINKQGEISLILNYRPIFNKKIQIIGFYQDLATKIGGVFIGIVFLIVIWWLRKDKKNGS